MATPSHTTNPHPRDPDVGHGDGNAVRWPAEPARSLAELEAQARALYAAAGDLVSPLTAAPGDQAERAAGTVFDRANALFEEIAGRPAATAADVVAKLRVLDVILTVWQSDTDMHLPLVRSALAAAERLARDGRGPAGAAASEHDLDAALVTLSEGWTTLYDDLRARTRGGEDWARLDAMSKELIETPAHGYAGVLAKLRAALHESSVEDHDFIAAAIADLERLAGTAAPAPAAGAMS